MKELREDFSKEKTKSLVEKILEYPIIISTQSYSKESSLFNNKKIDDKNSQILHIGFMIFEWYFLDENESKVCIEDRYRNISKIYPAKDFENPTSYYHYGLEILANEGIYGIYNACDLNNRLRQLSYPGYNEYKRNILIQGECYIKIQDNNKLKN
jgi:hypothetical protein